MRTQPRILYTSIFFLLTAALFLATCASDSTPAPTDQATASEPATAGSAAQPASEPVAEEPTAEPSAATSDRAADPPAAQTPTIAVTMADLETGALHYKKKCSTCHGRDGAPNEKMAAMLKVTMRPLGSPGVQALSDSDIARIVTEGNGKMKPVTGMAESDLTNVIAFLRTLN